MRRAWVGSLVLAVPLLMAGCEAPVRATRDIALTCPWEGYRRMEVHVRNGAVELRSADVDSIRISGRKYAGGATVAEAESNLEQVELHAAGSDTRDDTFVVELRFPPELALKNVGANLLIEVPSPCAALIKTSNGGVRVRGLADEVEIRTSNGGIWAADIAGRVTAETSNGSAEFEDVQGDLTASTSNGQITVRGAGGRCTLSSSNGHVRADEVHGDVQIESSNGGIRLDLASSKAERVELRTSNGSVHARLPEDLAAHLKLRTSSGRVHVSLGRANLEAVKAGRTHYEADMNGGGALVTAETSNGSITLECR